MTDPAQAWADDLDRLEQHLGEAETLLATAAPSTQNTAGGADVDPDHVNAVIDRYLALPEWSPTSGIGKMPLPLVARAEQLLARQRLLVRRVEEAMSGISRQRGFAHKVHAATTTRPRPVYLDLKA